MYEAFYGLKCKPFQLNPDPAFYYGSKQHRRAKAYLEYGIMRNEGFIVITGDIGTGKTTVLGGLLNSLDSRKVVVGQLVTTQLDAEDTLRMVGAAFGVRVKAAHKAEILMELEAFLTEHARQGRRCILVVDEAQNLSARAVEELRMLSNFQLGTQTLLQTFLLGQPEFRLTLQHPEMEQFRQRIAATCHLAPLDLEDTKGYIDHRLKCAGSSGKPEFDDGIVEVIFKAAQGVPRRINTLCDRLLLLGYIDNRTRLTLADVTRVVQEHAHEFAPAKQRVATADTGAALDIEPSMIRLDPAAADALSRTMAGLSVEQQGDRLLRLERALQRLEHINLQTLAALGELVKALKKAPPDKS